MSVDQVIKIKTRKYKVKKNQGYTVPSKGLIRSWKMVDENCNISPVLYINNRIIDISRKDKNTVCIAEIRKFINDIDCPEEEYEQNLVSFGDLFYNYQLFSLPYYPKLSNNDYSSSLFTKDIKSIQLSFGEDGPNEVEIEEEYWDRKGENEITQTEEDIEMQNEIKTLKPINQKITDL
jgi:hypothetical protein